MKYLSKITTFSIFGFLAVPLLAVAQATGSGINLTAATSYKNGIVNFINYIIAPVLMALAFIVFLWGVYKYFILGAADEQSRKDGRTFTLWGIIGFVVILSLWAIVNIVQGTLNLGGGSAPPPPTITGSSYSPDSAPTVFTDVY